MISERASAVSPPAEGPTWDELEVGLEVGPLVHTISPDMVRDFCAALPVEATIYEEQNTMPPTLLDTDYIPLLRGHLELGWGLMARHSLKILRSVATTRSTSAARSSTSSFARAGTIGRCGTTSEIRAASFVLKIS